VNECMITKVLRQTWRAALMSCCGGLIAFMLDQTRLIDFRPVRAESTRQEPLAEYGFTLPTIPMDHLPPAQACQADLPTFGHLYGGDWAAPRGSFSMSNDGGWCWVQFRQTFLRDIIAPDVRVIRPPLHGEAEVLRMADRVSVAYRPTTGFIGTDHFEIRTNGPIPHTIPFEVTVR
jgi:hypothetical protein